MIIAANFKTNMTRVSTREYFEVLNNYLRAENITDSVMVFPPATALDTIVGSVTMGAQNAYAVENGAFTGEIALEQLQEFSIETILIGHSERRHVLGETQEEIATKFNFYKEQDFEIVYCIGEPLEVRENGNDALMNYLEEQLDGIDLGYEKLIIAYEPVWAIGTGLTPSNDDILLIHNVLKQRISKPILYGGSVKPNIAREIMALESVDGVLVGGASLNVDDFKSIISSAK
ncbi:MAG: triose-phosphate isomerase [Campylobacterota bacterium]|nr:triose-phosphate isomerase [Campylobacterota bacterium]